MKSLNQNEKSSFLVVARIRFAGVFSVDFGFGNFLVLIIKFPTFFSRALLRRLQNDCNINTLNIRITSSDLPSVLLLRSLAQTGPPFTKIVPRYNFVEFIQWIAIFVDLLKTEICVKKSRWVSYILFLIAEVLQNTANNISVRTNYRS